MSKSCIARSIGIALVSMSLWSLAGCASVKSAKTANNGKESGLTYYLPRRSIVIEFTPAKDANALDSWVVKAGDAYPDLKNRYLLGFDANWLAKNSIKIGITERGLLSSASAESVSQVSEALQALATSWGTMRAARPAPGAAPAVEKVDCIPGQMYSVSIAPESLAVTTAQSRTAVEPLCGHPIEVGRLFDAVASGTEARPALSGGSGLVEIAASASKGGAGVFYRQSLPYSVRVGTGDATSDFVVFSPSEAPSSFLPVRRSLFSASNKADFEFTDGVPTSYSQELDGQAVALLKLPADVIGAYFDAIGNLFTKKKTVFTNEKDYLEALNKLATEQLKQKKCQEALASKDLELVKTACGE